MSEKNHIYLKLKVTHDGEFKHRYETLWDASKNSSDEISFELSSTSNEIIIPFFEKYYSISNNIVFCSHGTDDNELFICSDNHIFGLNMDTGMESVYIKAPKEDYAELIEKINTYTHPQIISNIEHFQPIIATNQIICKDCTENEECIFNCYIEMNTPCVIEEETIYKRLQEYMSCTFHSIQRREIDEKIQGFFKNNIPSSDYLLHSIGFSIYYINSKCFFDTKIILLHKDSI